MALAEFATFAVGARHRARQSLWRNSAVPRRRKKSTQKEQPTCIG